MNMQRWMMAVLLLLAAPAAAQQSDSPPLMLEVSGGGGGLHLNQDGYELVASNGRIAVGHFGVSLRGDAGWEAGFEYRQGRSSRIAFGFTDGAELRLRTVAARGSYGVTLWSMVRPYATLAIGATHGRLGVATVDSMIDDGAMAIDVHAAGGVEVLSPGRVRFGGYADVGYGYRSPLSFSSADRPGFGGPVDLGVLEGSGFVWRLGARVVLPLSRRMEPPRPATSGLHDVAEETALEPPSDSTGGKEN